MRSGYKLRISPLNAKVTDMINATIHSAGPRLPPWSKFAGSYLLLKDLNTLDLPKFHPKAEPRFHAASLRIVVREIRVRRALHIGALSHLCLPFAFTLRPLQFFHFHVLPNKIRFSLNAGYMAFQCKILDFLPRQVGNRVSSKRQAFDLKHGRSIKNTQWEKLKSDQVSEAWELLDQNMLFLLDQSGISFVM